VLLNKNTVVLNAFFSQIFIIIKKEPVLTPDVSSIAIGGKD
jgi:hypothetical protein